MTSLRIVSALVKIRSCLQKVEEILTETQTYTENAVELSFEQLSTKNSDGSGAVRHAILSNRHVKSHARSCQRRA